MCGRPLSLFSKGCAPRFRFLRGERPPSRLLRAQRDGANQLGVVRARNMGVPPLGRSVWHAENLRMGLGFAVKYGDG